MTQRELALVGTEKKLIPLPSEDAIQRIKSFEEELARLCDKHQLDLRYETQWPAIGVIDRLREPNDAWPVDASFLGVDEELGAYYLWADQCVDKGIQIELWPGKADR
jgi:hypothetical protein